MTYFYKTFTMSQGDDRIPEETRKLWGTLCRKRTGELLNYPTDIFKPNTNGTINGLTAQGENPLKHVKEQ